jgi:hypothetical protein
VATRTEINWAGSIVDATGDGSPELILGPPDARTHGIVSGRSVTLTDFRPAAYEGLAEMLGTAIAGDVVTPEMLAQADVIAFEHNGNAPAPSGGWESCDWTFSDGTRSLTVHWDERTVDGVPGHEPVPRDPHVVANGTVTGGVFGQFFGVSDTALIQENPGAGAAANARISFLLFRLRPDIDVRSPELQITLSGVRISGAEATPDPDAVGLLVHVSAPAAALGGTPAAVQAPAAIASLPRLTFDRARGWPPQIAGPSTLVEPDPTGVPFSFADWQRYRAIAVGHSEVKELLDAAPVWLGCHLLGAREEGAPVRVAVALRNSVTQQIVEVTIVGEEVVAAELKPAWGHPEGPSEMQAAIDLVTSHPEHGQHVAGLDAHAILRVPTEAGHPSVGHRCMHVMFTKPDDPFVERPVCFAAIVDLQTRTVIAARRCPCEGSDVFPQPGELA